MKLEDLLEGGSGSGRPEEGKRKGSNLWFQVRALWMNDIQHEYGNDTETLTPPGKGDTGDTIVTDPSKKWCYGVWRKDLNKGVVFTKPRPVQHVVGHRTKYSSIIDDLN